MVDSQEIVERTLYICLLSTALRLGYTLNPEDYLPLSQENEKRYQEDIKNLTKFIPIFGIGNNQVRGPKTVPRITLECEAYYPGDIGVEKFIIGDKLEDGNYQSSEFPFETRNISIDVHLVANNQPDMRLLHYIMHKALPIRGYVKPYYNDLEDWGSGSLSPTGNLFLEIGNFYDYPDDSHGLLEKVYTYIVRDGIVPQTDLEDHIIAPIQDISVLIGAYGLSLDDEEIDQEDNMLHLEVTQNNTYCFLIKG